MNKDLIISAAFGLVVGSATWLLFGRLGRSVPPYWIPFVFLITLSIGLILKTNPS